LAMSIEKLIDKMIQEAIARGEFDDLEGKGNRSTLMHISRRPRTSGWAIQY